MIREGENMIDEDNGIGVVNGGFREPITGKCSLLDICTATKWHSVEFGQPIYTPIGHRNDVGESISRRQKGV
jgi:hypothetical protein